MISVPTIISDIVTRIRNNTDSINVGTYETNAPFFDFGHHSYISNELKDKSKDPATRSNMFPLVALILDVPEQVGSDVNVYGDVDFTIILATATNPKQSNLTRETTIFKTILYPLYEDFLNQMWHSHLFKFNPGVSGKNIPHQKTDMYFYDSEEGRNKWNRYVDAIELQFRNLSLTIEQNC